MGEQFGVIFGNKFIFHIVYAVLSETLSCGSHKKISEKKEKISSKHMEKTPD